MRSARLAVCSALLAASAALAADVTRPSEVAGLAVTKTATDVVLSWGAVATDALGGPETIASYRVYRGTAPDFVPDKSGGSNRIGSSASPGYSDLGAANGGANFHYLVTAVDAAGNESGSKPSAITAPPVLGGNWTDTTIELSWTEAQPAAAVAGYRVYYGRAPRQYEFFRDVGTATSASLTGLDLWVNWYSAVVAIDDNGNESAFSNEHIDAVAGRVRVRAHNEDYLCWGAAKCPPRAGAVQRADGWQLMIPVDFPEGDWKRVRVTYTIDSRLCKVGQMGTTDKCGPNNPGGYNPCGDPWDRTAHLFLVLDETCLGDGASCINGNQLELMRAITPFGTDAPPPLGDGNVPPRVLTLDVTPFTPLLAGRKYVGAEIGHYVQAGWRVTTQFEFSERPDEASAKKPAAGVRILGFGGAPLPARSLSIPADATKVYLRAFTSGHGGTLYCDGGSNDGKTCTSSANCPGGSCQNCDEFCHRTNRILKGGSPVWQQAPWRTCSVNCSQWNACGFPSCAFARAGWCPGGIACYKDAPCDQDLDLTSSFPAGGTYDVSYDVLVQRGSWAVSLVAYWYTN